MCIFQLYQVSNDFIDEIIGSNSGYILSSLDYDTKFFLTLKDTNHHINVCLFGTDMEVVFWELSKKQKYRCYNKIFKNYLIIVNCDVCGLEIYNTNKICSLYNIYRLPFKIVDFDINDNNLVILTEKTIEFYKNYNGRR
ncbi:hypothetical protein HERIO_667 [Hepatospora eriocheir]|nr:hypothetical protein HERIO_667 [Hepatospora eriocheir]